MTAAAGCVITEERPTTMENMQSIYIETFFARQPIFSARKTVWGYELLYRSSPDDTYAAFDDNDIATLTVISNAIMNMPKGKEHERKILIHFTKGSILRDIPLALPPESTVVEVDESFGHDPEMIAALTRLKNENYHVAVNNFRARASCLKLYRLADIAFVDILGKDFETLKLLTQKAQQLPFMLAAKRVEDMQQFQTVSELGFALFQGFFFEKPQIVPGRKLSSNQISRLMLFKVLEKKDPDFEELAKVIEADVSISYRLLAFINSAAFSFTRKVESIKQALVLLGWKQIRSWLWLVILTDISPEDKTSELPYLSTIRGKFLERCVANHNVQNVKAESLYLLGLFSLLEAMLDQPMDFIAENLPLDDKIKAALCHEQNDYSRWLELARCFETGNWDRMEELVEILGLDPMLVANSYSEALVWAKSFHEQVASTST